MKSGGQSIAWPRTGKSGGSVDPLDPVLLRSMNCHVEAACCAGHAGWLESSVSDDARRRWYCGTITWDQRRWTQRGKMFVCFITWLFVYFSTTTKNCNNPQVFTDEAVRDWPWPVNVCKLVFFWGNQPILEWLGRGRSLKQKVKLKVFYL